MPIDTHITDSPASIKAKALWAKISEARTKADLLKWIKENMTGDQLIPNWGPHKQDIWFNQNGPIGDDNSDSVNSLKSYLKGIYKFWVTDKNLPWQPLTNGQPDDHLIDARIKEILAANSSEIVSAAWNNTLTDKQKENNNAAKTSATGRYNLLATDYYNHIYYSSKQLAIKGIEYGLREVDCYAIAIYSSAQFTPILGIARGVNKYGNQFNLGDAQDLWFLAYAVVGIKKIAKIETVWRNNLTDILTDRKDGFFKPSGVDAPGFFLRRDMDYDDKMIEEILKFSQFKVTENNILVPESKSTLFYEDKGMMSTSYDNAGIAPYSTNSNVTLFIQLDKNNVGKYGAIPLEKISRLPMEKEILWAPRTQFEILGMYDNRKTDLFIKDKDWRSGTRQWSETEKLWVFLKAPLSDDPVVDPSFTEKKARRIINTINFERLIELSENKSFYNYSTADDATKGKGTSLNVTGETISYFISEFFQNTIHEIDFQTLNSLDSEKVNDLLCSYLNKYIEYVGQTIISNQPISSEAKLALSIYSSPLYKWLEMQFFKDYSDYSKLYLWVNVHVKKYFEENKSELKSLAKSNYFSLDFNWSQMDLGNTQKLNATYIYKNMGFFTKVYRGSYLTNLNYSNKILLELEIDTDTSEANPIFLSFNGGFLIDPNACFTITSISQDKGNNPIKFVIKTQNSAVKCEDEN